MASTSMRGSSSRADNAGARSRDPAHRIGLATLRSD
jgi:hypothetical protein